MKLRTLIILAAATLPMTSIAEVQSTEFACPVDKKGTTISQWRDSAIARVSQGNYSELLESINQCFPTAVPKCLDAAKDYAQKTISVAQPAAPTPLSIQSELDLPPEFLPKDAEGKIIPGSVKIPDNIFELAQEKKWKVLDYKTRSTGGFDNAPNLLLVVLQDWPVPNKDVFLQISPPPAADSLSHGEDPKPSPRITSGQRTLTVITADKTVNPPVGQLRLMNGADSIYRWNNNLQGASCIACHTVPLRAISPRGYDQVNFEKLMTDDDQKLVSDINQLMKIDNFSWGTDQNGNRLGAKLDSHPYGWAPPNSTTRTEAYIRSCFAERNSQSYSGFGAYDVTIQTKTEAQLEDWVKIKNAMNCVGCHDNKTRGYLHEGYSFDEIKFKVLVDRSMPLDVELNTDERLTLIRCIQKEHGETRPAWIQQGAWMKKVSCGL